jgi:hypothetical protein
MILKSSQKSKFVDPDSLYLHKKTHNFLKIGGRDIQIFKVLTVMH